MDAIIGKYKVRIEETVGPNAALVPASSPRGLDSLNA